MDLDDAKRRLGANIARLREDRDLTQEALAERASIHPVLLSRLERGATDPRVTTVLRVARGLETDVHKLFDGID